MFHGILGSFLRCSVIPRPSSVSVQLRYLDTIACLYAQQKMMYENKTRRCEVTTLSWDVYKENHLMTSNDGWHTKKPESEMRLKAN
jgi:hypothetical protein